MKSNYAISCDNEAGLVLSNERELESWERFEKLIKILLDGNNFSDEKTLFAWKAEHHLAQAREPYAWRAAIEEIKNSDLGQKCREIEDREEATFMSDKPTMLKIAGEITNALMHSYSARHKTSFVHRAS